MVDHGDSGSPILNAGNEVVGIASSGHKDKIGATNIVRAKYLRKLLEFYQRKNKAK
jgi:V8-like Glu-specific endopeptidase